MILFLNNFGRVVEHLLRNDANPSMRDQSGFGAVHYAALNGHNLALEMVRSGVLLSTTIVMP